MKKVAEYRQHAEECRSLARTAQNEDQRGQLLKMADTWDKLAAEREPQKNANNTKNRNG